MHVSAKRALVVGRIVLLVAAVGATSWAFTLRTAKAAEKLAYSHWRIPVDSQTAARWNAGEVEVKAEGAKLIPMAVDPENASRILFAADARTRLSALKPSERHGAGETQLLSTIVTDRAGEQRMQSSGVVAQITLVKGSEYKSEADFQKGWVPFAIVVLPDTFPSESIVYPALKLHGGTTWVYAHEDVSSHWMASLVRIVGDKIEQDSMPIEAAMNDKLEPVVGARFLWEDGHEGLWGICGGRCCKIVGGPPPQ